MLKLADESNWVPFKERLVDVLYAMMRGPNYADKKILIQ